MFGKPSVSYNGELHVFQEKRQSLRFISCIPACWYWSQYTMVHWRDAIPKLLSITTWRTQI